MEGKKKTLFSRLSRILRMVLVRLLLIVGGLVAAFLVFELVLIIYPDVFNLKIQNLAFGKYDNFPDGIYKREPTTRMHFMKPDFQTRVFLNGYWWNHSTDANGFRNPADLQSYNIALLGDSLIYGHGVEEEKTVGHFLRSIYNYKAYNMSRQADCIYNHYVLLRMFMSKLQIKTVLVFVFINDIRDTETYRRGFIKKRPEINTFDYDKIHINLQKIMISDHSFFLRLLFHLHTVRLVAKFFRSIHHEKIRKRNREFRKNKPQKKSPREKWVMIKRVNNDSSKATFTKKTKNKAPSKRGKRKRKRPKKVPYYLEPILDAERFRIVSEYYDAVLEDLSRRCREQGVRLVLIHLDLPKNTHPKSRHIAYIKLHNFLKSICDRYAIELFNTHKVFKLNKGCYLKHDGHLSEKGHRILAEFLHERVLVPNLPGKK